MGQRGQLDRIPVAHSGPVLSLDWVQGSSAPSTLASSFRSSHLSKDGRITVAYWDLASRTPSPTPSEAEMLIGKSRSCDIKGMAKKYLNKEWVSQPRNIS